MKILKIAIVSFFLLFTVSALADELRIDIVRVFMREPGDYLVMHEVPGHVLQVERLLYSSGAGIIRDWIANGHTSVWNGNAAMTEILISDVPADKPMYIVLVGKGTDVTASIHVHSAKDINGTGWSTGGKYPKHGENVEVE